MNLLCSRILPSVSMPRKLGKPELKPPMLGVCRLIGLYSPAHTATHTSSSVSLSSSRTIYRTSSKKSAGGRWLSRRRLSNTKTPDNDKASRTNADGRQPSSFSDLNWASAPDWQATDHSPSLGSTRFAHCGFARFAQCTARVRIKRTYVVDGSCLSRHVPPKRTDSS